MKFILLLLIIFSLSACEGRFSSKKNFPQGKRLSVLTFDKNLSPDPKLEFVEVALPRPIENKNWSQDGGSKNNNMQHLFIGDKPKLFWKTRIGNRSSKKNRLITNPIIYKNNVYAINSKGYLIAINFNNGKPIWKLNLVPKGVATSTSGGGMAVEDDVIYITTGFGIVYAVDCLDGKILWKKNISIPLRGSPTLSDEKIFFISILNQTFALNKKDGNILWVHSGVPETTSFLGGVSPAVYKKIILSPYSSGEVYALDTDSGKTLWAKKLIQNSSRLSMVKLNDIHSRPIIVDEKVYLSGSGGKLLSVDINSGSDIWSSNFSIISSPWISGEFIYFVTLDNQLICVNINSGLIKWVNQLPIYKNNKKSKNKLMWVGPILVSNRIVLLSSLGVMTSISPYTGKTLGTKKLSSEAFIEPIVAKGTMIVLTDDGKLSAFR